MKSSDQRTITVTVSVEDPAYLNDEYSTTDNMRNCDDDQYTRNAVDSSGKDFINS